MYFEAFETILLIVELCSFFKTQRKSQICHFDSLKTLQKNQIKNTKNLIFDIYNVHAFILYVLQICTAQS